MFDGLQGKLQEVFRQLKGEGRVSAEALEGRCGRSGWRCSRPTSTSGWCGRSSTGCASGRWGRRCWPA